MPIITIVIVSIVVPMPAMIVITVRGNGSAASRTHSTADDSPVTAAEFVTNGRTSGPTETAADCSIYGVVIQGQR